MNIFAYDNYRKIVRERLNSMPKRGYGQAKKLAEHLSVSTTLVSQILTETKHFTLDQAFSVTEFFGFSEHESRFFIVLVNFERAGNSGLRQWLKRELDEIRKQSQTVVTRLVHQKVLTDEQKGVFYSDWSYSAVRMLTSIKDYDSIEVIGDYLGLPRKLVVEVVQFLISAGLIVDENGKLKIGPQSTHLGADSPWAKLHHSNWRSKALDHVNFPDARKLHYSSPMTLSQEDVDKVREKILSLIEEVGKIVDPSPAEKFMCLNVDWFQIHPK